MSRFRKIQTSDRTLMQVQDAVADSFRVLFGSVIGQGVLLTNVLLGTSAVKIDHKLNRQPLGFIVVDLNKSASIFRTAWDVKTISLQSSAVTTTVSIWVF